MSENWDINICFYSHLLPGNKSQWTMWLTSLNKKLYSLVNHAPMRKVDTDHPVCPHMQVFIHPTSICIVVRCMISAHAVTLKSILGVMVNASGSLPDADPSNSMSLNQVTTNCVIVNSLLTHHSATALINTCSNGYTNITEVSGVYGVLPLSGLASATGHSLSTSEQQIIEK